MRFRPGQRHSGSNLRFNLAAYALERFTRKPFERAMREEVFEPLGMTAGTVHYLDTFSRPTATGHWDTERAPGTPTPLRGTAASCLRALGGLILLRLNALDMNCLAAGIVGALDTNFLAGIRS